MPVRMLVMKVKVSDDDAGVCFRDLIHEESLQIVVMNGGLRLPRFSL